MVSQNVQSAARSLIVGTLLAATPISSVVSAQDAITLEMIGAVRMARPVEVRAQPNQGEAPLDTFISKRLEGHDRSTR